MSRRNKHDEEEEEWLFESIVNYLSSPIWTIPIQHFFETNCTVFSPSGSWSGGVLAEDELDDDAREVPKELLDVHKKYKDLVDALINSFIQDIGISHSKFVRVCQNSSQFTEHPIYLELFEQVWCADNFKLFKAQMIRKNVELELQALVLLQYQLGIIRHDGSQSISDDEIMALVIKKSKDEYDAVMNSKNRSRGAVEMPIQREQDYETAKKLVKSDRLMENLKTELDQQEYINKKLVQEELSVAKKPLPSQTPDRPVSASRKSHDVSTRLENLSLDRDRNNAGVNYRRARHDDDDDDIVSSTAAAAASSKIVNNLAENILAQSENISENEIKRRAEFMQKQRDLLAEKKKIERQKQLDMFMKSEAESSGGLERPMSSRAARKVLQGADPTDIKEATSVSHEDRKRLEARKALAETLKKEVINNSKKY